MTRQDFIHELIAHDIKPENVSFDNSIQEGYGLRRNHSRWEIFYRERGVEYNTRGFPTESDALTSLLEEILRFNIMHQKFKQHN